MHRIAEVRIICIAMAAMVRDQRPVGHGDHKLGGTIAADSVVPRADVKMERQVLISSVPSKDHSGVPIGLLRRLALDGVYRSKQGYGSMS